MKLFFLKILLFLKLILKNPFYFVAFFIVIIIRIIKPLYLIRIHTLYDRLGHLAGNTELYLCEMDEGINKPSQFYCDLFYVTRKKFANKQLLKMWKRILIIWPQWILEPISIINYKIPGGKAHQIGFNSNHDRDVLNLFDKYPGHVAFTDYEKEKGSEILKKMGVNKGNKIVCLQVRDSAYLSSTYPKNDWSYHDYRDSDIDDYILAAEELVKRGYYVIRMGAKVNKSISTNNPKIIDYATNGMRSDFMDIYLGSVCDFILTTGTGWCAVPIKLFRKPTVKTNFVPIGLVSSYHDLIFIPKKCYLNSENRILNHSEIYNLNLGFAVKSEEYSKKNISLIENTPNEIKDVCIEMVERLNGVWISGHGDEKRQNKFWDILPTDTKMMGWPMHGKIKARIGASYLRNNPNEIK